MCIRDRLLRVLKDEEGEDIPVKSQYLARLIKIIEEGKISRSAGKEVFDELATTDKTPETIIQEKGFTQISGTEELGQSLFLNDGRCV